MGTLVHHWGHWLILMKGARHSKGHIYSHICSVNRATADQPPSISLCRYTRGSALFWLDVNDVYTCACGGRPPRWTAAIAHDGAGPQAGMQLAGQTMRHLLGVVRAVALRSPAACSHLLPDTSCFFPPSSPITRKSILQAECRLNQSWHAECPWVDWHSYCRCVCACVGCWSSLEALRDTSCIISSSVKGYHNKPPHAIHGESPDWAWRAACRQWQEDSAMQMRQLFVSVCMNNPWLSLTHKHICKCVYICKPH